LACDPITFHDVDQAVYDRLGDALRAQGAVITDDSFSLKYAGTTVSAKFDRVGTDLTITVTKKPALIPCGVANKEIRKIVERCGGT
jgi:hypothetical protein